MRSRSPIIDIDVHPVTPARWPDLERLFGPRGATSGCWCMWWRLSRAEFSRQTADERRAGLAAIVAAGDEPGILAYVEGEPAAWCAVAPRECYPSLERSPTLKRVDDAPVWSIVCLYVGRDYRRRGIMQPLINAAVDFAAARGAQVVEAYPVDAQNGRVDSAAVFTGVAATFARAGFTEVARRSPRRPIMRHVINQG